MPDRSGLTLVEVIIGALTLALGIVSLLGALVGQITLSEQARSRLWANTDASRVMEQLRRQNHGATCTTPSANPPAGFASWDAWLADTTAGGGGGKSVQPNPAANELVVVTASGTDPLTVTVAACWRQRNRVIGECTWNGAALSANPGAGGNPAITESTAMFTTTMTCRT
ncbi:MAG: type II secretion system protein [Candidatus Omnitrophica bacterium]|nr:type II secretion system protein [Candidatus Omnitrophota bacterium]